MDDDPNAAAVAATLQIPLTSLWTLRRNAAFPAATTDDGHGALTWTGADATALTAFESLWASAISNGWRFQRYPASWASLNFAYMAAHPVGPYYGLGGISGSDPLWDI